MKSTHSRLLLLWLLLPALYCAGAVSSSDSSVAAQLPQSLPLYPFSSTPPYYSPLRAQNSWALPRSSMRITSPPQLLGTLEWIVQVFNGEALKQSTGATGQSTLRGWEGEECLTRVRENAMSAEQYDSGSDTHILHSA